MASTHILCTGKIIAGEIEMDVALLPWLDPNEPVELKRLIDEAEDTLDYEWDIEQRNLWRTGNW